MYSKVSQLIYSNISKIDYDTLIWNFLRLILDNTIKIVTATGKIMIFVLDIIFKFLRNLTEIIKTDGSLFAQVAFDHINIKNVKKQNKSRSFIKNYFMFEIV